MPKLSDLNSAWIDHDDRRGLGVEFDCMVGSHFGKRCECRIWILFANPIDGGATWPGESRSLIVAKLGREARELIVGCGPYRWTRTGDTFDTLTMTPSVDAHACGHFTLTNGVFR